jgi:hypothetical protein
MRLTSTAKGSEHHVTIPANDPLPVGTLNGILKDVASYLEMDKDALIRELFGSTRRPRLDRLCALSGP